jgi:hypothetical protein
MTAITSRKDEQIFAVKSTLAKLLATENLTIRHEPGATTAAFDTKARVLYLPVWENISGDLYDLLVVHETGHALYTPSESWINACADIAKRAHGKKSNKFAEQNVKMFMNVVEDARIDKLQKRRYPGSKRNYLAGYKELFDRDFFGIKNKDVNSLTFIDRANVYFKGGLQSLNIIFTDQEKKFIDRMERLETFDEVLELTEELYNYAKMEAPVTIRVPMDFEIDEDDLEDLQEMEGGEGDEDEDSDEENGKVSRVKVKSKSNKDKGKETKEKSEGSGKDKKDKGKEEKEGDEASPGDNSASGQDPINKQRPGINDEGIFPTCSTEQAAAAQASSIVAGADVNYIYLGLPKFNIGKIVDDFQKVIPEMEKSLHDRTTSYRYRNPEELMADLTEWRNKEKDTINYMVKEFEMRKSADTYSRTSIAKTGVIDTNKLHSYKYNDDVFKRLTVVPQGKNHGFVMVIDWSSSMAGQLGATVKQLISLVLFCKKVQIPFEVFLFRSLCEHDGRQKYDTWTYNCDDQFENAEGTMKFGGFKLRNILSSRMNISMLNRAISALWLCSKIGCKSDPMASTPLNQSIVALPEIIHGFRKRNKVQVVNTVILTDGGSDPVEGMNYTKHIPTRRKGTKVILTDDKTKKTYVLNGNVYGWGYDATMAFLDMVKEQTGCNLIGFYMQEKHLGGVPGVDGSVLHTTKNQESWTKNNFIAVDCSGYDEYYVVDAASIDKKNRSKDLDTTGMSQNRIIKEFMKLAERKAVNRVLLNKFIARISADRKKA